MLRSGSPHCFMFNASTTIFPQIGEMGGQREKKYYKKRGGGEGGLENLNMNALEQLQ